jgi:hypothetical protein
MTMRETDRLSLSWMENYGLARILGASIPDAIRLCEAHPEETVRLYSALVVARQSQPGVGQKYQAYTSLASAVPVVGQLISAAGAVIGKAVGWLEEATGGECEKSYCPGSDSRARAYAVSLDGGWMDGLGEMLPFGMHDGLVVDGPGAAGTSDQFGRLKGAGPLSIKNDKPLSVTNVFLRANPFYGLGSMAKGDWNKPWTTPGTYYWRAWKVRAALLWMKNKMTCPQVRCMGYTMTTIVEAPAEAFSQVPGGWFEAEQVVPGLERKNIRAKHSAATDLARRKGSRWYATVYKVHRDVGEMALGLPREDVVAAVEATGGGGAPKFLEALDRIKSGPPLEAKNQQWPWWYATKNLSWDRIRKLLPLLHERVKANIRTVRPGMLEMARAVRAMEKKTVQPAQVLSTAARFRTMQKKEPEGTSLVLPVIGGSVAAVGLVWLLTRKG